MKRYVRANSVSDTLPARLDNNLQNFAQTTGRIRYNDIMDFGQVASTSDIKQLNKLFRTLNSICRETGLDYYDTMAEDAEAYECGEQIVAIVNGTA